MPPSIMLPASLPAVIPNSRTVSILTIDGSGAVVPTQPAHIIAAASGTADDLVTVTTTNFKAGDTIKISPDTGDTITIKASGGNITTDTGLDIVLDAVTDYAWLHVTASGVVASLPGRAPEYRYIFAADYGVAGAASVGAATAQDTAFALAVAALNAGGGGTLVLPGGVIRLDAQHTFDVSGCHVVGRGRSGLTGSAEATILDLRYNSGPPLIFGNGSTYRRDMSLRSVHIECANGATSQPAIRTRYVRGFTLDDISTGGVYTLLEAGQSGEPTSFIHLGDIEGNAPASHSHFVNFINAPGPVWIADELHYEGQNAANAYCFNWSTTSVATDGLQVGACTVRLFERIFNCRPGLANWVINGAILDYFEFYGIYADTDVGSINKIIITGSQINGDPSGASAFQCGVYIAQTTSAGYDVTLGNNEFYSSGGPAVWVTGDISVTSTGNIARDCGQAANATYSSFRYGSSCKGAAIGNTSRSNSANKVNYGHHFEGDANGSDFYLDERSNVSLGHVTRACGFTVLPRRATQFVLRIRNNGGTIEHSFVSVSRNDSVPGGTFISAIQNPTTTWTTSPTGTDASTAMAAGAKIATSISKMMALDTADLNNNYDFVMARIDPLNTTTTGITKVNSRIDSYSINGVTRSRLGIRFDADINTTNITAGQELWVECHGQMKGYY